MNKNKSWGNYPKVKNQKTLIYDKGFSFTDSNYLSIGLGRSYGDVGLNENGNLISTVNLKEIISFDEKNGVLNCSQ